MLGTVESINDKITLLLDGDNDEPARRICISPKFYPAFDHGYATTIQKSQGATVDRSFVPASKAMDQHLPYVAMAHRTKFYLADNEVHQSLLCDMFEKDQK